MSCWMVFPFVVVADDGQSVAEFGAMEFSMARASLERGAVVMGILSHAYVEVGGHGGGDASDGNEVGFADSSYGGIRLDGVGGKRPADSVSMEGRGIISSALGGASGARHIVEHDVVDPAGDGLADFGSWLVAFHSMSAAEV